LDPVATLDLEATLDLVDKEASDLAVATDLDLSEEKEDLVAALDLVATSDLVDTEASEAVVKDSAPEAALVDPTVDSDQVETVDLEATTDQVDLEAAVMDLVDLEAAMDQVDLEAAVMDQVDLEAVTDQVDLEAVKDQVDPGELAVKGELGPTTMTSGLKLTLPYLA
jgi:hypothetical protein